MTRRRALALLIVGAVLASTHWIAYTRGGNDSMRMLLRSIHPDLRDPCRVRELTLEPTT